MLLCMQILFSFFKLKNTPLYVYTTHFLFVVIYWYAFNLSIYWLLWIMLQWKWVAVGSYLFNVLISIILDKYTEVELQSQMVGATFNFLNNSYTAFHTGCTCFDKNWDLMLSILDTIITTTKDLVLSVKGFYKRKVISFKMKKSEENFILKFMLKLKRHTSS